MAFVHTSNPPVRPIRGPLRALHNNLTTDTGTAAALLKVVNPKVNSTVRDNGTNNHDPETNSTPVQRATNRQNVVRQQSMQNVFPLPLRTSSCRASKSARTGTKSSTCDIRNHFRVRGLSSLNLSVKSPSDDSTGPSPVTIDPSTDTSCYSTVSAKCLSMKRRCSDGLNESIGSNKQMRYSDSAFGSGDRQPVHMTMGAFVKAHPRYCRRRNSADPLDQQQQNQQHAVPVNRRLSPICPVPMPCGFPNLLPATYAAVSLPWEAGRSPVSQRTVETQTTPPSMNKLSCTEENHSRSSLRHSFGSTQVLCSLRRTFGNLRRAISAERLHRSSRVSVDKENVENVSASHHSQKSSSQQKLPQNIVPEKMPFRRIGSKKNGTGMRRAPRRSICSAPLIRPPEYKSECRSQDEVGEDPAECLTYHVLGTYPDGSIRLQLRRASTKNQFGLFIARDSQGVYVSRLGSVRCTVKLWDILHVGDRLLEVQGVPCTELEVEDVQNLIRGCELVEFRVQSLSGSR